MGKALISIRNRSVLKVKGENKEEIYQKLSVLHLGEEPMSTNSKNKEQNRQKMFEMTKVLRKVLPSLYGLMLQVCGSYISKEEFEDFKDITKHERLANILKNATNLHGKLVEFCEMENVTKPQSLITSLDYSCLT